MNFPSLMVLLFLVAVALIINEFWFFRYMKRHTFIIKLFVDKNDS